MESPSGVVGFQFGWAEGLDVGVVRRVQRGRPPAGIGCLGEPVPYLVDRVWVCKLPQSLTSGKDQERAGSAQESVHDGFRKRDADVRHRFN